MLDRFRIGSRLAFGFGGLIATAALVLGVAVVIGVEAQRATTEVARATQDRLETVYAMERAQLQLVSAVRNAGLQTDAARINQDIAAYQAALKTLKAAEARLGAMPLQAEERRLFDSAVALRQQAEPLVDEASRYTMALAGEEAAKVLAGPFATLQERWAADLGRLGEVSRADAERAKAAIAAGNQRHWTWLAVAMLLATMAAVVFAVVLTRSVTRPLRRASELARRVAEGDLSVHIDAHGRDEAAQLLRSLQAMAQQLAQMVRAVRECSESIETASREISSGNLDLSSRTETQAASLQQAAATLSDLSQAVAQYSSHADRVRQLTEQSAAIADESGSTMQRMASTMNDISDSSRRIGEIIGVIDGIAFQTNILALNAAVEAARAGEQGRGFAVVASEVRALAQRVSQAAGEVRGLIGESVTRVEGGTRLVAGMGDTMQGLLGSVSSVRTLVSEISAASQAQSERLREVDGSVRAIDGATQQNAALVEQVASAAQSLSGQTGRLSDLVRRFRLEHQA